jgi:hypothetical protein
MRDGGQSAEGAGLADAVLLDVIAPRLGAAPWVSAGGVPVLEELGASPVGVPLPSVPAPPDFGPPPVSTVVLAWMIA